MTFPTADTAATDRSGVVARLESALRAAMDGEVAFDDYSRHIFSRDASMYSITPLGVVFPRHADDVAAAEKVAGELGVPIVAGGAGTILAGETVRPGSGRDLSRHVNRDQQLDPLRRTRSVERQWSQ